MKIKIPDGSNTQRVAPNFPIEGLTETLHDAEALLIVPPFAPLEFPSLGAHILQACGRMAGFRVQVLYANLILASVIGEEPYAKITNAPHGFFAGERFFARCAFGLPHLGRRAHRMFEPDWVVGPKRDWEIRPDLDRPGCRATLKLPELRRLEKYTQAYVDGVAATVSERRYSIVGCTGTFAHTTACVALLNRIKVLRSDTTTILGGGNCDGEMATGIASLPSCIDYIFSGESEFTFPKFVRAVLAGWRPPGRLISGELCRDLDALPTPTFVEFYEQRSRFLPASKLPAGETQISYETSRGCWWGQKHHCTFCGFDEESIAFRRKSPERVISDLRALLETHPTKKVNMTDSIMPHMYFKSLLPRIADELPGVTIFYETKANLTLSQILALKRAGITSIQPGIESLSSRLLSLMNKGVQARQNLMLLRYARAAGVDLHWHLLWGFPGDDVEAYEETLAILPLVHHLQPPNGLLHLSIDRGSPYFTQPAKFGVRSIKPLSGYYASLPKGADVERIANEFTAEYRCGAHDHMNVIHKLWQEIARWRTAWKQNRAGPNQDLALLRKGRSYLLVDSRGLWKRKRIYSLEEKDARDLLTAKPHSGLGLEAWALGKKLAVIVDGWFVPLAVADAGIFLELTEELNHPQNVASGEIKMKTGHRPNNAETGGSLTAGQ